MIFFDLGDTLVEIRPEVYASLAQAMSFVCKRVIGADNLRQAIKDEWVSRNSEDIGWVTTNKRELHYLQGFYRSVLQRLNVDTPPKSLLHSLAQRTADQRSFKCFDDVTSVLETLQEQGTKIGLVSNAFPSARRILDYLDLTGWFKPLVLSYEHPWTKPNPGIYNYALCCADVLPEEVIFVDDRPTFVKGASDVGMKAKLIDRENSYRNEQNRISGLSELLEIL